ncbi:uncharacterized protein LOC127239500 [Andrographis paniculata]|uniref:uncharacterized protein LOC127239500 n=1 Tax=Andrographis paniculata TaxID=175694 RepID=UPI0021E982D9|nr:uncharacterized protein LOC127239500 [Andrographis paniculata]
MGSFSGLGIGLSFLFGCILMGLVAELYYLLWWKKRVAYSSSSRAMEDLSFFLCWKRPQTQSSFNSASSSMELTGDTGTAPQEDLEMGRRRNKEMMKMEMEGSKGGLGLGLGLGHEEEGSMDTELMRLHNLRGPPRFLFTIKEENKEDLDSEDGNNNRSRKGSRTSRSLSDLVFGVNEDEDEDDNGTPFLTPLPSPTVKAPFLDCYSHGSHGSFNPLFESSSSSSSSSLSSSLSSSAMSEAEINRLRSSPPPKFKFLRDAEEKLIKRLLMVEAQKKRVIDGVNLQVQDSSTIKEDHKDAPLPPPPPPPPSLFKVLPLDSSPILQETQRVFIN